MLRNGIKCIYFGNQAVSDYHGEAFEITGGWLFISNAGDRIRTDSLNLSFINTNAVVCPAPTTST